MVVNLPKLEEELRLQATATRATTPIKAEDFTEKDL
jgi:hypothetical protein